jgi:hypothetical protein
MLQSAQTSLPDCYRRYKVTKESLDFVLFIEALEILFGSSQIIRMTSPFYQLIQHLVHESTTTPWQTHLADHSLTDHAGSEQSDQWARSLIFLQYFPIVLEVSLGAFHQFLVYLIQLSLMQLLHEGC